MCSVSEPPGMWLGTTGLGHRDEPFRMERRVIHAPNHYSKKKKIKLRSFMKQCFEITHRFILLNKAVILFFWLTKIILIAS